MSTRRGRVPVTAALAALALLGACASNLDRVTSASKRDPDRPLVIMATADWCGPCKDFKARVLPTPQVQAALRDINFVILDDFHAKDSLRRLGIRSYPTFAVVTADREVVAAVRGAMGSAQFIDFLTWATPRWFAQDPAAGATGSSPRPFLFSARWHAVRGDLRQSWAMYRAALEAATESEEWRRPAIAWEMTLAASARQPIHVAATRAVEFVDQYPHSYEVRAAAELVILSRGLGRDATERFGRRIIDLVRDDPQALNSLAYDLLAGGLAHLAVAAAVRQVALAPGSANAYDTLAEAYNAAGDKERALSSSDRALALETSATARRAFAQNRDRFAEGRPSPAIGAALARFEAVLSRYQIRRGDSRAGP